tara:strand:+ start:2515 stop:2703 length:189 start_codon:yes stop_codon:yes gene_type:complete
MLQCLLITLLLCGNAFIVRRINLNLSIKNYDDCVLPLARISDEEKREGFEFGAKKENIFLTG